jgi:hypothetical protein
LYFILHSQFSFVGYRIICVRVVISFVMWYSDIKTSYKQRSLHHYLKSYFGL